MSPALLIQNMRNKTGVIQKIEQKNNILVLVS
jgi:hypothetical protein